MQESHNALVGAFGSEEAAKKALLEKAAELNMPPEQLTQLAATSPAALQKVMGVTGVKKEQGRAPDRTGVLNTEALLKKAGDSQRDFAFYQKLKKDSPSSYFSKDTQSQMFKDARKLGDAFFGN